MTLANVVLKDEQESSDVGNVCVCVCGRRGRGEVCASISVEESGNDSVLTSFGRQVASFKNQAPHVSKQPPLFAPTPWWGRGGRGMYDVGCLPCVRCFKEKQSSSLVYHVDNKSS